MVGGDSNDRDFAAPLTGTLESTCFRRISITRPGPAQWSLVAVSGDLEITWHGMDSQAAAEALAEAFLAKAANAVGACLTAQQTGFLQRLGARAMIAAKVNSISNIEFGVTPIGVKVATAWKTLIKVCTLFNLGRDREFRWPAKCLWWLIRVNQRLKTLNK